MLLFLPRFTVLSAEAAEETAAPAAATAASVLISVSFLNFVFHLDYLCFWSTFCPEFQDDFRKQDVQAIIVQITDFNYMSDWKFNVHLVLIVINVCKIQILHSNSNLNLNFAEDLSIKLEGRLQSKCKIQSWVK